MQPDPFEIENKALVLVPQGGVVTAAGINHGLSFGKPKTSRDVLPRGYIHCGFDQMARLAVR